MDFASTYQLSARAAAGVSPFQAIVNISHGTIDPNRTSNLSLHYPDGMLLSPWPVLVASAGLSLVLGLVGFLSAKSSFSKNEQGQLAPVSIGKRMAAIVGVLVSTVRTISLVVLSAKIGSMGSIPAPSSMLVVLVSLLPYVFNPQHLVMVRTVAGLDFLVVFTVMTVLIHGKASQSHGYGQLALSGGNCPTFFSNNSCSSISGIAPDGTRNVGAPIVKVGPYAGCAPNATQSMQDLIIPINFLNVTEKIFGYLSILYASMFLLFASFFILGQIGLKGLSLMSARYKRIHDVGRKEQRKNNLGWNVFATRISLALAVITILVIVPEHWVAQAHPSTYSFYDSFGPPVLIQNQSYSGDNSSWTDCFEITPPANGLGFIDYWWASHEGRALHILAGI